MLGEVIREEQLYDEQDDASTTQHWSAITTVEDHGQH